MKPIITVVMIDSRSDLHPDWVQTAIASVKRQVTPVEFIIVKNIGREKTIGKCWNEAVKEVKTPWTLFLGDDDWISPTYCAELAYYTTRKDVQHAVSFTTHMIVHREYDDGPRRTYLPRPCTGMWRTDYLLKHPFNEDLPKGIDREYIEEVEKRGDTKILIDHCIGYYYRQHDDYSCAGKIQLKTEQGDVYVNTMYPLHTTPYVERLKKSYKTVVDSHPFEPHAARDAKVIWCDWGNENAVKIANFDTTARKVLRIHAYEVFGSMLHYINMNAYDKVIFVAKHIKEYAEKVLNRTIDNAVVIPNGVDTEAFTIAPEKHKNRKIAYAGELSRKKGVQLMLFLAEHFPEYEFCVAGKFPEPDIAEYFYQQAPDNVVLEPYSYDLNKFFEDKTYFLLTSPREGCNVTTLQAMSAGLKPLVYDHIGSREIFGDHVFRNIAEFEDLLKEPFDPEAIRDEVLVSHDMNVIYSNYKAIFDELMNGNYPNRNQNAVEDADQSRRSSAIAG